MLDDLERRKARLATGVKWALGLIGAAIIAPVIFFAVQGLVGLALAGIIGLAIVNFAPVLSMKFANWKLKGIVGEARANPIETLRNQFLEKKEALERFLQSIEVFATEVRNFEDRVRMFTAEHPSEAKQFEEQLAAMKQLLAMRKQKYRDAGEQLKAFGVSISKASAKWDMAQAAIRMNKLAGMQTGDPYEAIKVETAIDSVQSSMNQAFAELETALVDVENVMPALPAPDATTPAVFYGTVVQDERVQR